MSGYEHDHCTRREMEMQEQIDTLRAELESARADSNAKRMMSILIEIQALADESKTDGGAVARAALFAISEKCRSALTEAREWMSAGQDGEG